MKYLGFVKASQPGTDCSKVEILSARKGVEIPSCPVLLANSRAAGHVGTFIEFDKCVKKGTRTLIISSEVRTAALFPVVSNRQEAAAAGADAMLFLRRENTLAGCLRLDPASGRLVSVINRETMEYSVRDASVFTVYEGKTYIWEEKLPSSHKIVSGEFSLPQVSVPDPLPEKQVLSAAPSKGSLREIPAMSEKPSVPAEKPLILPAKEPDPYEKERKRYEETIEKLRQQNGELRAELAGLKSTETLYLAGCEEFFQGETKDMVLAAVDEYIRKCEDGSRRKEVLEHFIINNDYQRILEKRREAVKNLLKGYDGLSEGLKNKLEALGFRCTDVGKHYKIRYYGDSRYWVTMAKTPGDSQRGDKNLIAKLVKLL